MRPQRVGLSEEHLLKQNQALHLPRVFVFCGDHHTGTNRELQDLDRPKVHDPKPFVCHPPVTSDSHFDLSDPSRQPQSHFAD